MAAQFTDLLTTSDLDFQSVIQMATDNVTEKQDSFDSLDFWRFIPVLTDEENQLGTDLK